MKLIRNLAIYIFFNFLNINKGASNTTETFLGKKIMKNSTFIRKL